MKKRSDEFVASVISLFKSGSIQIDIAVQLNVSKYVVGRVIRNELSKQEIEEIVKNRKFNSNLEFLNKEYGKLTVKGISRKAKVGICFECTCKCNPDKIIIIPKYWVLSGNTKSCGCGLEEKKTGHEEISGKYWGHIQKVAYERSLGFDIDIEYGWEVFLKQNKKCKISGVDLCFVKNYGKDYKLQTASLDRIDNSKGYLVGNVQWVHKLLNKVRNDLDLNNFFSLAKKVNSNRAAWEIAQADNKWYVKYLLLAETVASWSKDVSTKVGAVIFDDKYRVVSLGYNGLPQGVFDREDWLNNREIKYKVIIHAEVNSMLFAERDLTSCSIATWPLMPCSSCASMIVQKGIKNVISIENDNPRWQESFLLSKQIFKEAGVNLRLYKPILPDDIWL